MARLDTLLPDERHAVQGGLFVGATSREQVHHRVVALVARVLEKAIEGVAGVTPPHRNRGRVGRGIHLLVFDRESIVDGVRIDQREALNKPQRFTRPPVCCLNDVRRLQITAVQPVVEVNRFDDQGVALPMAAPRRPATAGYRRGLAGARPAG